MSLGRGEILIRFGLIALAASSLRADDPAPDAAKAGRQARLDFMKAKLGEFRLAAVGPPAVPLALSDEPALRWTNPIRGVDGDGATFFWSEGGRPVAVATISIRAGGKVFREFALLGDRPIEARRAGNVVWSPRKNSLPFAPLDDAPGPAKTPAQRLAQLRAMARRFRVDLLKGKPTESRLLTQPLVRYSSPGLIEGAVFAFAEATDPEALLILEARSEPTRPEGRWFFSVARMTSPGFEIRLGDSLIWSALPYWNNPRARDDPYSEAYLGLFESPGE